MAKTKIVRTSGDNKFWLVDVDNQVLSEIESEAMSDSSSWPADAEMPLETIVRAHAASHAFLTT
jgi:hypothetical protein